MIMWDKDNVHMNCPKCGCATVGDARMVNSYLCQKCYWDFLAKTNEGRMNQGKCKTCKNYHKHDQNPGQGQCRADPPRVFPMPGRVAGSLNFVSTWPPVSEDNWCGKYAVALSEVEQ